MSDKGSIKNSGESGTDIENIVNERAPTDITLVKSDSGAESKQITKNSNIVPRGICDPIIALDQYTDETLEMLDEIQKNQDQKHSKAPPLRFYDVTREGKPLYLDPKVESIRNRIWGYWYDKGLSTAKMVELLHIRNHVIIRHLAVCKARYDEWIDQYGLTVYGNPAQRLDDLLKEFKEMLADIERDMDDEENSRKDIKELRKLKLEILDRVAKYQAIEPPKSIDLTIRTPAEETRDKMVELFPDGEGVFQ
ncbi:MAG: hypothetical protein KAJ93_01015 [Methanosarcinales archaeon]|nr:hypothetical protein [Methanosarcinales archaeon]